MSELTLNEFGLGVIKHLARIANALEAIEAKAGGAPAKAATTTSAEAPAKGATRASKPKETPAKPKHDRDEVQKALVAVKDKLGKDEAVAVYKGFGYDKMADIAEKDFDAIYDKAISALEADGDDGEGDDL